MDVRQPYVMDVRFANPARATGWIPESDLILQF